MKRLSLLALLVMVVLAACTKLLEEQQAGENTYSADNGCVYCHTNAERLKALAPAEQGGDGAGGG